jgi:signal transduction histidine kinase
LQQFTYIVSHNLRAPLANALGIVGMLSAEVPGSAAFMEAQTHLLDNLQQLDQVLRDMNTILSIRDRQGIAGPETVPLRELVQQVVQGLADVLKQIGGTVQVNIAEALHVRANLAYLHSIFLNLLSNALKYRAPERSLRVSVTATGSTETQKQVTVTDNGLGFDRARAGADVFQLYKRFHPQHPGRGLGLYLVKTHLATMGGHIEVNSQENEGTSFTLILP